MSGHVLGWLIAAGVAVYYVSSCIFWPYADCWFCTRGRKVAWWGGGFRPCGWCGGSGRRLRVGRWLFNTLLRIKKEGQ